MSAGCASACGTTHLVSERSLNAESAHTHDDKAAGERAAVAKRWLAQRGRRTDHDANRARTHTGEDKKETANSRKTTALLPSSSPRPLADGLRQFFMLTSAVPCASAAWKHHRH